MVSETEYKKQMAALREAIDTLAALGVPVDMEQPITDEMFKEDEEDD